MDDILEKVKLFDEETLRKKLKEFGVSIGPVNDVIVRRIFQKKLTKFIAIERGISVEENNDGHISIESKILENGKTTDKIPPTLPQMQRSAELFYSLSVPSDVVLEEGQNLIFTDKVEAFKTAKRLKGSRFKVFKTIQEAEEFCKRKAEEYASPCRTNPQISVDVGDGPQKPQIPVSAESSLFKGPKVQDLMKMRKMIEKGDLEGVKELVLSNPRYLVSSGDTPTILQEGFRYNALHVAAKCNQAAITRFILDTLETVNFVQLLYPQDSLDTSTSRIKFLVDLYINMPDKGNNETPLYFASKFGNLDVLEVLATHPRIQKQIKSKFGETPADVLCSRVQNVSKETKDKMKELLEDQFYVPLLRSDDNSTPPVISEPWSPEQSQSDFDYIGQLHSSPSQSPRDPLLNVKAFAGPMSPSKASAFHKQWMGSPTHGSPTRNLAEMKKLRNIKYTDPDKGVERIGRTPPEIGGTATPNNLDRDYHLELVDYVTGRVLEGAVPIGTVVQLRIRAEGADNGKKSPSSIAGDENGLQVSKCTASNSDLSNTVTLIDNYCSEFKDGIDFVEKPDYTDIKGFQSVDLLSWSPAFEMFAIAGGPVDHVVIFECDVTICRIDGECDGDNCPSKRKRRRVESAKLRNVNGQHRSKRAADSVGEVGLSATVIVDESEKSAANGTNFDMTALIIAVSVLLLLAVAAVAVAMRLTQSKKKARSRTSRTAHIYHHDNQYNDKVQHGYKETYY